MIWTQNTTLTAVFIFTLQINPIKKQLKPIRVQKRI